MYTGAYESCIFLDYYYYYLGTTITDALDDTGQYLFGKRTQCVAKNNELMQEFHYAQPSTKTMVNNVFNAHTSMLRRCGSYFP